MEKSAKFESNVKCLPIDLNLAKNLAEQIDCYKQLPFIPYFFGDAFSLEISSGIDHYSLCNCLQQLQLKVFHTTVSA